MPECSAGAAAVPTRSPFLQTFVSPTRVRDALARRRVMRPRLIANFICVVALGITLVGYPFNTLM